MQTILGWLLIIFPGILYTGQVVSSVNFPLAQRIGLQEDPDDADPLLQRVERYTAYWDLLTLVWLPVSGILMVVDHAAWPLFALAGGAIYLDAAGREAVKILSFKHENIRLGSPVQQRFFFSTYLVMALLAIATLSYAISALRVSAAV
ncbi:MAG: hypothetical protein B6D72_05705 [gamma proteobacterium symbiont of Ctena orbiculata]|uniref:Uncharacterized protein n=1 Tax=Candidatus Thiodiazotropha taylori TaxID=2792791 RepID=A0A944QTR9_9GAMM|nr:hypothetical protein [Candidatus Thiodiazotropha taylori]PUB89711.1 MAG: hypothetical protein DBP00_01520 [gamma proteobacterium symbiont of Ctena orbiculata]MBT2990213.1 hypothetical protein [Candidatus Thiodiazotropha taylori]MBT2997837.1 hypothetical protein [Candidatus Thiodiazotropha taylori]MBT3000394.1 hypothetical protein [Candidatus Thiodiazotropha taylori]